VLLWKLSDLHLELTRGWDLAVRKRALALKAQLSVRRGDRRDLREANQVVASEICKRPKIP
jgi:hypothetical protein